MPPSRSEGYPTEDEVIDYLTRYEQRYAFPIERSCRIETVERDRERLRLQSTDGQTFTARAVVSATGTRDAPYQTIPAGRLSAAFSSIQPTIAILRPLLACGCWLSAAAITARRYSPRGQQRRRDSVGHAQGARLPPRRHRGAKGIRGLQTENRLHLLAPSFPTSGREVRMSAANNRRWSS